jgi:uncharacterized membrane protein
MDRIPQRIIFSRKGFDSKAGGFASPIIPLGTRKALIFIPIPRDNNPALFQNIQIAHRASPHFANMGNLLALGTTASLVIFFLWTAIAFVVMPSNIGAGTVRHFFGESWFTNGAAIFLYWADAVWPVLGALAAALYLRERCGWRPTLWVIGAITFATAGIELIGILTGFPFGPYEYSGRLGYKILGLLPITVPAGWLLVIVNCHFAVPSHYRFSPLCVGALAVLTDLSLEFTAWKLRGYWTWYPGMSFHPAWPPLQNYASWFLIVAGLDLFVLRKVRVERFHAVPVAILIATNLVFILSWLINQTSFRGALLSTVPRIFAI